MTSPSVEPIPLPPATGSPPVAAPAGTSTAGSPAGQQTGRLPLMFSANPTNNLFTSPPLQTQPLPQLGSALSPPSPNPEQPTAGPPPQVHEPSTEPQPPPPLPQPESELPPQSSVNGEPTVTQVVPAESSALDGAEGEVPVASVVERQAEEDEIIAEQFTNEYHDILVELPAEYKRNLLILREVEDKQQGSIDQLKLTLLSHIAAMSSARTEASQSGDGTSGATQGDAATTVQGEPTILAIVVPSSATDPGVASTAPAGEAERKAEPEVASGQEEASVAEDVEMAEAGAATPAEEVANVEQAAPPAVAVSSEMGTANGDSGTLPVMKAAAGDAAGKVLSGDAVAELPGTAPSQADVGAEEKALSVVSEASQLKPAPQQAASATVALTDSSATATDAATATATAADTDAPAAPAAPPKPVRSRDQMLALLAAATRAGEDKIGLAHSLYDSVDRHIRRLDADLAAAEDTLVMGLRAGTLPSHDVPSLSLKEAPGTTTSRVAIALGEQAAYGERSGAGTGAGIGAQPGEPMPGQAGLGKTEPSHAGGLHGANAAGSGFLGRVDPNEPVFCYCQRVSFGEMIGCENDDCQRQWFHLACVGLNEAPRDDWWCPDCAKTLNAAVMKRQAGQPGDKKKKKRRRIFS